MRFFTAMLAFLQFMTLALAAPLPSSALSPRGATENYIVIFEKGLETPDSVSNDLETAMKNLGVKINYEYHSIIKGFSISLDQSLLPKLEALNDAKFPFLLEQDKSVHTA